MPNILTILVENPDELLNVGAYGAGAVIRVQTSATVDGVYADVSGTGSTPTVAIVTATRTYTAYDPAGISTSWYRRRYENVGATRLSEWTPSFQAHGVWPDTAELAQVLNLDDASDWQTTLDRVMAAAIRKVKGDVGLWVDAVDEPDSALAQAALRMAELMATRPDSANSNDQTYLRLLSGHRRRFGLA